MNTNNINNTDDTSTTHKCGLSAQVIAWIMEHGSEFLRFCVEKGYSCRHIYNVERTQLEAPGWSLLYEAAYPPSNPPAEAMELLSRGRERFPQARLRQVFKRDHVEFVIVAEAPWPDGYRLIFDDRLVVAIKDN